MLRIKNWDKFQHYRDRCPPWIKLATDTFQNIEFARLQPASKLLALCVWTLASRSKDGTFPDDLAYIRQWGFLGETIKQSHLNELINQGFVIRASEVLADCKQVARPETETETEGEGETEENYCAEPQKSVAHTPNAIFLLPLNDKTFFEISQSDIEHYTSLYPGVSMDQAFRSIIGWCESNPTKRKTRIGIRRFVNSWLAREQDKPRNGNGGNGRNQGSVAVLRELFAPGGKLAGHTTGDYRKQS